MMQPPAPRYTVNLNVELVTTARVPAVSRNISTSGILIHSARPLPAGTRVRLEPLLAGGMAEVVWARETKDAENANLSEADIGLKFISLPQHDRDTIVALIRSLER